MTEEQPLAPATAVALRDTGPSAGLTPADILAAIRRRRLPALCVFAVTLLGAVIAASVWPASYRSSGTILIEQQELPPDLVRSTITSFADQRIQVISQRVMTTDNLLRVIDRYNLYPEVRRKKPREVLLAQMRRDIHLQMISADVIDQGHAMKANIAFTLAYDSVTPDAAARVANEIISLYLDENVKTRRRLAAEASGFLDDEANKLDARIAQLEAKVTAFKDKHINTLPDQTALNNNMLIRFEDEVREIDTQMSSLDQQLTYLDAQLAQITPNSQVYTSTGERVMSPADRLKYLRTEYLRLIGIYAPEHPDIQRIKSEMDGLEKDAGNVDTTNDLLRQLATARSQLEQLQQRYAPDHPDVVRVQQQIDSLTRSLKDTPAPAPAAKPANPDNPAYIQVKAQREANGAQREALAQKRAAIEQQIDELDARIAAAPAVEREYADLLRELNNEQVKYTEVRQKQMAAKLSENLEDEQKGERFTLIEPPLAPEQPTTPNRPLLLVGGMVVALAAGLLTIIALETTDGSVRNRRELERLLEVPPLAILPMVVTLSDLALQRRRRRFALLGTMAAFALALVLTHVLYRPLDMIWYAAVRRIGG